VLLKLVMTEITNTIYDKKLVLLVEDDVSISNLYEQKLELSGFNVRKAHNGLEALKTVKELGQLPDLVLLDLMMPVMDGEEFLRRFRKNLDYSDIPVVVLTNLSRSEAPKTLWHYGISGYFVKAHHTPKELVEEIKKVLE